MIGAGKTMCAVRDASELARRRGAVIASNIRIDVPGLECFQLPVGQDGIDTDALQAVMDYAASRGTGVVLLADEIGIIFPARAWAKFPVSIMFAVSQSRKQRLDIIYTSQDVEQVDAFIRRLTSWVYQVQALPVPTIERQEAGRRPWLFRLQQFRPTSVGRRELRLGSSWRRYRREVEGWYNTDELVRPAARLLSQGNGGEIGEGSERANSRYAGEQALARMRTAPLVVLDGFDGDHDHRDLQNGDAGGSGQDVGEPQGSRLVRDAVVRNGEVERDEVGGLGDVRGSVDHLASSSRWDSGPEAR